MGNTNILEKENNNIINVNNMVQNKIRDNYADVIKAIGIISIVIGHSSWYITKYKIQIGPFVYSYHLMIFMFVSGYLFNTLKLKENNQYKSKYIANQIVKMAKLYFIYNLVFVILHNLFVKLQLINSSYYSTSVIVKNIFNGLTFITSETLLGTFWFIPMMLIAKILFVCVYDKTKNNNKISLLTMILFGILGILLCYKNIHLQYMVQTSILSVFFMYLGLFYKKHFEIVDKYVYKLGFIPSSIIIYKINYLTNSSIELSVNRIINPFIFFIISITGIYFCLSLAKFIMQNKFIEDRMADIGKNSFHIMALHFLFIKIIDIIYCMIKGINDYSVITKFPNSFELWYLYIPFGVILPVLLIKSLSFIKIKYL